MTALFFILLVTFLIAFPKGGIKVADVPVTIGYVILAIAAGLSYFRFILNLKNIPRRAFHAWLLTLPFQLILMITYATKGVYVGSTALLLANFTCFIFMPTAFLLLFSASTRLVEPEIITKLLVIAIRFICIFGLIVFFTKTFSGYSIEIPFITVNIDDIGALESKNNTRGSLYKLISTYNNGNIFGACLGMMLPLYYFIEKRKAFFIIAAVCMTLTLSRTAWMTLVVALMAISWVDAKRPSRILALGGLGLLFVATVPLILEVMGRDSSFIFDSRLGGRNDQFNVFNIFAFLPQEPVGPIFEITYASIYRNYGLIGLMSFVLFLLAPIIATLTGPRRKRLFNRAAAAGLGVYMVTAWSDGATLFIPTMAIYFFLALLALEGNVDVQQQKTRTSRSASTGRARYGDRYAEAATSDAAGSDNAKHRMNPGKI